MKLERWVIKLYFPSQKDLRYLLIYMALFLFTLIASYKGAIYSWDFISNLSVLDYFLTVLLGSLIGLYLWIWLQTGYKIEKNALYIKSGPFRKTIKIEHIRKLSTSKISFMALSPFSGPALSTELIEITYGKHDEVINISPINKKEFVKVLVAENTEIHDHTNI